MKIIHYAKGGITFVATCVLRLFEYYVWYVYMYVILIRDIFWKSSYVFLYLLMMRLCGVFEYVMT